MLTKAAPSRRFNAAIRKILYGLLMCLIDSQPINAGSDTAELLPMGHHLEGLPAKPLSPSPQDQILQSFDLEIEPRLSHYGIEQICFYGLVEEYAGWRNYDWQQLDDAHMLEIANTLLHRLPLTLSVESLRSLGCQDELLPQKTWLKLGQSPDPESIMRPPTIASKPPGRSLARSKF